MAGAAASLSLDRSGIFQFRAHTLRHAQTFMAFAAAAAALVLPFASLSGQVWRLGDGMRNMKYL